MSYAIPTAEQYPLKPFFVYSVLLHLALSALVLGVWVHRIAERWGGPGSSSGESMSVILVPGAEIPLVQPTNITDSGVVDPTNTLHKEEPLPPARENKTPATEISRFTKGEPLPPSRPSKIIPKKTTDEDNAVPGHDGSAWIPSGLTPQAQSYQGGGITVQGPGDGDFAGRYPWYVQSMVRAISQNWMQSTIDAQVRAARHVRTTITFTIYRDGSVKNLRITESSGNRSMDDSARRALLSIDHFPTLPTDYSGHYVDVTFDFDLGLSRTNPARENLR